MFAYRQNASATHAMIRRAVSSEPLGRFIPCQVVLLGQMLPRWEFVQPLTLSITRDDDRQFIASDDIFHMYGLGNSLGDAVKDYLTVLSEYYQHLSGDEDAPSVALFEYLQRYMRPR
jgi:hypothetical protein